MGGGVSRQRRASPAALPPSPSPAAFSSFSSQESEVGKNGEDRRITKEVTSEEKEDFRVESESDLHHHDEEMKMTSNMKKITKVNYLPRIRGILVANSHVI